MMTLGASKDALAEQQPAHQARLQHYGIQPGEIAPRGLSLQIDCRQTIEPFRLNDAGEQCHKPVIPLL